MPRISCRPIDPATCLPTDDAKADFRRTPLAIEGETLILPRFDRTLRFRRR
jgi:hypothetical protein